MNKEEALAKLCQYSTCNYKEQIWAPEAKELLEYWSGVEKQIKQLQQENNQLKEQRQELRSWLEDELKDCNNYSRYIENKLQELKARSTGKTYLANEIMKNEVAKKCFKDVLKKLNELEGKNE